MDLNRNGTYFYQRRKRKCHLEVSLLQPRSRRTLISFKTFSPCLHNYFLTSWHLLLPQTPFLTPTHFLIHPLSRSHHPFSLSRGCFWFFVPLLFSHSFILLLLFCQVIPAGFTAYETLLILGSIFASLSLSLAHTYVHTPLLLTHYLTSPHTSPHTFSLPLSLTRTRTRTCAHTLSCSPMISHHHTNFFSRTHTHKLPLSHT